MAMLKAAAADAEQDSTSWDQGELAETMWAEMGIQPDAYITQASPAT